MLHLFFLCLCMVMYIYCIACYSWAANILVNFLVVRVNLAQVKHVPNQNSLKEIALYKFLYKPVNNFNNTFSNTFFRCYSCISWIKYATLNGYVMCMVKMCCATHRKFSTQILNHSGRRLEYLHWQSIEFLLVLFINGSDESSASTRHFTLVYYPKFIFAKLLL